MKRTVLSALCLCCIGGSMAGLLLSADAVRPDQVALGPVVLAESGKPAAGAAGETEVRMPSQDVIDLYKAGKLREARASLVRLVRSEIEAVKGITRSRRHDLARGLGISLSANTIAHCFDLEVKHGDGSVSDELVQIAEDVLPAVDLALQRAQKGPTSEIRFKQKIQYAKDKKTQLLGKLIAVLRAAGRGKKADAIADRYKEDLQRGKATKRPATRPADLDAIAKRLTKAIGDTWEKENLTILGKPVTVLKATVRWTAPKGITRSICRLYPFGFDRSGRKKIIASPSEGDAGYAVVGYGDRWTVTAYPAFGNPAEMIPAEAIAKEMGLKSQYITGSSLHCARWLEDNFDQFVLHLRHHGPKDKRLPSLTISARRIKDAKDSPEQLYAVIGRKPGLELIHHLLLARCFEDVKGDKFRYPEGPVYTVTVPGGDRWKQHKLKYYKDFGWGLGMLKRLDSLRKILDGDPAKAMDKLLNRLAEKHPEWKKPPGKTLSVRQVVRGGYTFIAICEALNEPQAVSATTGAYQKFKVQAFLDGARPAGKTFNLNYQYFANASSPERFVRKGEKVIWIVRKQADSYQGAMALAYTPENHKAVDEAVLFDRYSGKAVNGLKLTLRSAKATTAMRPDGRGAEPVPLAFTFTNVGDKPIKLETSDHLWPRLQLHVTGPDGKSVRITELMVERIGPIKVTFSVLKPGQSVTYSRRSGGYFGGKREMHDLLKPGAYRIWASYLSAVAVSNEITLTVKAAPATRPAEVVRRAPLAAAKVIRKFEKIDAFVRGDARIAPGLTRAEIRKQLSRGKVKSHKPYAFIKPQPEMFKRDVWVVFYGPEVPGMGRVDELRVSFKDGKVSKLERKVHLCP